MNSKNMIEDFYRLKFFLVDYLVRVFEKQFDRSFRAFSESLKTSQTPKMEKFSQIRRKTIDAFASQMEARFESILEQFFANPSVMKRFSEIVIGLSTLDLSKRFRDCSAPVKKDFLHQLDKLCSETCEQASSKSKQLESINEQLDVVSSDYTKQFHHILMVSVQWPLYFTLTNPFLFSNYGL